MSYVREFAHGGAYEALLSLHFTGGEMIAVTKLWYMHQKWLILAIFAIVIAALLSLVSRGARADERFVFTRGVCGIVSTSVTSSDTNCYGFTDSIDIPGENPEKLNYSHGGGGSFTNNNSMSTTDQEKNRNPKCEDTAGHHPIQISTQSETMQMPLFALPGEMGLRYTLYYNSYYRSHATWTDNLDYRLYTICSENCPSVMFSRPDGSTIYFSGGPNTLGDHPEVGGGGLATLTLNSDNTWTLHDEDGSVQTYDSTGTLLSIKDSAGIGWTISRNTNVYGTSTATITHTSGRSFAIVYQYGGTQPNTITITDPSGNVYIIHGGFGETDEGYISDLTLPGSPGTTINYKYSGRASWLSEVDYNGAPYLFVTYDDNIGATGTHLADGSETYSIGYTFSKPGVITAAVVTNPLGHLTTKQYSASYGGQPLLTSVSDNAVSDCGATLHSFVYDGNGYLKKATDNNGVTHTYTYASNGQLLAETEASGTTVARTTNYGWDPNAQLNRLTSVTITGYSKTVYSYNTENRIASVTRTNLTSIGAANQSLTTTYAYMLYGNGMVETMTVTQPSPSGSDHTTYAYDAYGNLISVTDGLGHATTYSGYNGLGEVGKIVGPNGDETDYTYDARGRTASKTTHPNGTTATWTYGYDGFGLLAKVSAPDGEVTTWSRDAEQRVKTITHNDKDGTSTESFTYDANNDVISDVIARGSDVGKSTSYVYDALGRIYQIKGSKGETLTYAYDDNGNVLSVTDAIGHKTSYAYDALNRVIGVTNAASGITSYTYDAGDHVTGVKDPRGLTTAYMWDGLGQLWQQNSPDTGITGFAYDAYGRLAGKTRASGVQVSFAYDALNRPVSQIAAGTTHAYTWDVCTNGIGRLCAATVETSNDDPVPPGAVATQAVACPCATPVDSVGYSYSPEGWITGRNFNYTGGASYGLGFAYDNMGHLAVVDYPDGNQALYDYTNGVVADVRFKVGAYTVSGITGIDYRPLDLAMSSWTSYNGLSNTIGYDSDLRPTSITVPNIESLSFAYNSANQLISITNGMNSSLSQALGYDALNRLTSMKLVNYGGATESYAYDADGNRTSQAGALGAATFAYASGSNRLLSTSGGMSATYGYDANGNITTVSGTTAYTYGPFNHLINAGGAGFMISAEGQRIEKLASTGPVYFAPDAGGELLAENTGGAWRDYVWLNGRLVTLLSGGGVWSLHDDQTGRPLVMTNMGPKGAPSAATMDAPPVPSEPPPMSYIVWQAAGAPFDRTVTNSTWGEFNIGFPGQYYDQEDNLWYNGARDYNATLGRYMESDPIGLAGGVNTYAYVGDNPISNVDPSGLCPHKYSVTVFTLCSAAEAFSRVELPGVSAPGAPEAQDGSNVVQLWGNNGNNWILQSVDSSTMRITNFTLPGHQFYPGTVTWQVTPGPAGFGSFINVTGIGDGPNASENEAVGLAFFGGAANAIAESCVPFP